MARAVRLPDMIWKNRAGAEVDPSTSISIAKNGGFSGTQGHHFASFCFRSNTCCNPMSEAENRQGVECGSKQKRCQNLLEPPLMVELVELGRLNKIQ